MQQLLFFFLSVFFMFLCTGFMSGVFLLHSVCYADRQITTTTTHQSHTTTHRTTLRSSETLDVATYSHITRCTYITLNEWP